MNAIRPYVLQTKVQPVGRPLKISTPTNWLMIQRMKRSFGPLREKSCPNFVCVSRTGILLKLLPLNFLLFYLVLAGTLMFLLISLFGLSNPLVSNLFDNSLFVSDSLNFSTNASDVASTEYGHWASSTVCPDFSRSLANRFASGNSYATVSK